VSNEPGAIGAAGAAVGAVHALALPPSLLGESPFWHPDEAALYWCDIPGRTLNRYHPQTQRHSQWRFETEPACAAPLPGGELLLAMRDGLFRFDPVRGERSLVAPPPYDPREQRFNDGKADPLGRLWVGTIFEPRTRPGAALYRASGGRIDRMAEDVTVSNGLAFSPDARTLYWSDTTAHRIDALDLDLAAGSLSRRRVLVQFAPRQPGQDLLDYGGRPDGAAVDAEGAYWVAMFEGQRLLRLSPAGAVLAEIALPVRCPTMPCFGGADLKTLFVTTAREKRPAEELAAQPLAGCVLTLRVAVPGLPVNFARLAAPVP
jgi:sugar lactone lactonase YvrE